MTWKHTLALGRAELKCSMKRLIGVIRRRERKKKHGGGVEHDCTQAIFDEEEEGRARCCFGGSLGKAGHAYQTNTSALPQGAPHAPFSPCNLQRACAPAYIIIIFFLLPVNFICIGAFPLDWSPLCCVWVPEDLLCFSLAFILAELLGSTKRLNINYQDGDG